MNQSQSRKLPDPRASLHYQFQGPLYRFFLNQADRVPDTPAVLSRHGSITYAELDALSNRVAGCLQQHGLGRGQTVAIFTDRNPALVWAILGVLKAGAAFLIGDAAYPAARIVDCLTLARPSFLLVCGDVALPDEVAAAVRAMPQSGIVRLPPGKDAALAALAPYNPIAQPAAVGPDDVAYIGFTSGSTGRPKGIVTTHAPLGHFVEWHVGQHSLGSGDRFALLSGLSHDPALRDIFTPLSVGACLSIPDQEVIFDPFQLSPWLAQQRITVLHLTPALGQVLVTGAQDGPPLDQLRYFFWGGDLLSSKLVQRVRAVAPNAGQVNFYGATETPQAMSCFDVDSVPQRESYPVGTGISDVQLLVVTEAGRLAEVEEIGEIVIRTPYLSRGYLNDPDQTQARFVANPFTGDPNDRCYRTGDLGKYLSDGNVAFAGRSDHQVKIRGFRVELDEVTARIEQQPGVARAVVQAKDLGRESRVLVAYFMCDPGKEVSGSGLQEALRRLLPPYMEPAFLVRLDRFPLLPNGKINLLALPAPSQGPAGAADEDGEPRTDRERELVAVWRSILGVERISIHDRFTDLGGDSLSAIRALVSMRRLGISEAVARGVVQGKTIAQMVREEQEGTMGTATPAPLGAAAQTSLLVNLLRAVLVTIVVLDHWFPGLLKRLPSSLAGLQPLLEPLFNIATPGFAFVFGISLGYGYYPRFKDNPSRVRGLLRFGLCLLGASVLIQTAFDLAALAAKGKLLTATVVWSMPFGPLPYYFLALLTVPLWFRFIARWNSEIVGCVVLALISFLLYHLCLITLYDREQTGFLQLCRLMLVAKFAYFNMSIGALGGMAMGIYLVKRRSGLAPPGSLSGRLLLAGVLLELAGLFLLYLTRGSLEGLFDERDMGLWRWLVYPGAVLILAAVLNTVIQRYDRLPAGLRTVLDWGCILGQCSLLVFVLHSLVLPAKALLDATGLPQAITLPLPLLVFVGICGWTMGKLYRIYHGKKPLIAPA